MERYYTNLILGSLNIQKSLKGIPIVQNILFSQSMKSTHHFLFLYFSLHFYKCLYYHHLEEKMTLKT